MIRLVVTFGMPIPANNGFMDLTAQYDRVVDYDKQGDVLAIRLEDGRVVRWNWAVVRNILEDPHGSILKPPQGAKIVPPTGGSGFDGKS